MATTLHPNLLPGVRWVPHAFCFRVIATVLAVAISGRYGLWLTELLGFAGGLILAGAALAWGLLLAGLWVFSDTQQRWPRLDWAVWTMTVGSVVMALALLAASLVAAWLPPPLAPLAPPVPLDEFGTTPMPVLLTLLIGLGVADLAMGWVLVRNAPAVGLGRRRAAGLWIGGMNGFLGLVLAAALLTHWMQRIG